MRSSPGTDPVLPHPSGPAPSSPPPDVLAPLSPLAPRPLLTPSEVAALFRVDPKTVSRWSEKGLLDVVRTPGGHRRFFEAQVRALLPE
jgi:excisionase family DNA binding protein